MSLPQEIQIAQRNAAEAVVIQSLDRVAAMPKGNSNTPATTALIGQILVMAELLKSALGVVRTVTGDTLEDDEMLQDLITQSEAAIATVLTEHAMGAAT